MNKILVVDDEATITTQLEERLTHLGYTVIGTASCGKEALELARQKRPDVILMDIVMPGEIDGIEAAAIIKKELDIPVVFLTAYGDDKLIKRAKIVEPLGYLLKPYQGNQLKAALEVALYNKNITQRLQKSEVVWRSLAQDINEGLFLSDGLGKIFFWNKGAERIFEYSSHEACGKPLTFIMSEGSSREYRKEIKQMITSGDSPASGKWKEVIGLKKDWSKFPIEMCISPWKAGENVSFISIVRDITTRKKEESYIKTTLQEKNKELKEIKEHIKSDLQLVYNLLDLQNEYGKNRQSLFMSEDTAEHISSVSAMLAKISKSSGQAKIDFSIYVHNLAARLIKALKINQKHIELSLNIDNSLLDPQTAIPCGIIISELLSNALKHAFPNEQKGKIWLDFFKDNKNQFALVVKDNGIGFPKDVDYKKPDSQGLRIVTELVKQCNGTIKLDRSGGTKFMILLP